MGDAAMPREHILIAYFEPLPPGLEEAIKAKFPNVDITTVILPRGVDVPSDVIQHATILVTFTNLPRPEDAHNSGIHGPPIAEWTLMNWLISSRKFITTYENQKKHHWDSITSYMNGMHDQVGKAVGILGYGSIGRQIGRAASALGMRVYAFTASPRLTPDSKRDRGYIVPGTGDADGAIPVSWHHGMDRESVRAFLSLGLDHLVVSLPLTPQTTHLLGEEEFRILSDAVSPQRPRPFVTNISRGKVFDQDALIAALTTGVLGGAALDVADPEPLPADHPLWEAPNCHISPHVSSLGKEYFPRSLDVLKENLGRMERGEELVNEYKRGKAY
ncbi:D-isomer specific 2-hydroxyacid dehydrogenase family protein [Aspergillus candidus]|uniref:D-isomer specific 2-hydroxyacid dehydrogenase NAD-binding domain-containing protein n=1 Tax=Aspergillus candidus TaxID=41067 RepID=A0A2I2F912_ASPCN|nr:hypothetical protein BDW47DRAFT_132154 [Aspergillus candidus]PLB37124.1 hypothetical protein BDW47DRAFT_132154 [Aspergillus candidus]